MKKYRTGTPKTDPSVLNIMIKGTFKMMKSPNDKIINFC